MERIGFYNLKTRYDLQGFPFGCQVRRGFRTGKKPVFWGEKARTKLNGFMELPIGRPLVTAFEFARERSARLGVPVDVVRYRRIRDGKCDWIPVTRGESIPKGDRYSGELIEEARYQIR